jgi:hypothetical protein
MRFDLCYTGIMIRGYSLQLQLPTNLCLDQGSILMRYNEMPSEQAMNSGAMFRCTQRDHPCQRMSLEIYDILSHMRFA